MGLTRWTLARANVGSFPESVGGGLVSPFGVLRCWCWFGRRRAAGTGWRRAGRAWPGWAFPIGEWNPEGPARHQPSTLPAWRTMGETVVQSTAVAEHGVRGRWFRDIDAIGGVVHPVLRADLDRVVLAEQHLGIVMASTGQRYPARGAVAYDMLVGDWEVATDHRAAGVPVDALPPMVYHESRPDGLSGLNANLKNRTCSTGVSTRRRRASVAVDLVCAGVAGNHLGSGGMCQCFVGGRFRVVSTGSPPGAA